MNPRSCFDQHEGARYGRLSKNFAREVEWHLDEFERGPEHCLMGWKYKITSERGMELEVSLLCVFRAALIEVRLRRDLG